MAAGASSPEIIPIQPDFESRSSGAFPYRLLFDSRKLLEPLWYGGIKS